jgi:glutathione peroxidase
MDLFDAPVNELGGGAADLHEYKDKAALIVNVASKCGLTPQYEGLQRLYDTYKDRGLVVLGFPCNQFLAQEPGSDDEIRDFCSVNYGVTFPLFQKIEVNGDDQHPLYEELNKVEDDEGYSGDIRWNFEKFLVAPGGASVQRFNPTVKPEDPKLVDAIEAALPS